MGLPQEAARVHTAHGGQGWQSWGSMWFPLGPALWPVVAAQSREGPSAEGSGVKVGTVRERTGKVWDVARAVASRDWNRTWDPDTREGGGVGLNVERNFLGESFFIGCAFIYHHYALKSPA